MGSGVLASLDLNLTSSKVVKGMMSNGRRNGREVYAKSFPFVYKQVVCINVSVSYSSFISQLFIIVRVPFI